MKILNSSSSPREEYVLGLFKMIIIMLFWTLSILLLATISKPSQIAIPYCRIDNSIEK